MRLQCVSIEQDWRGKVYLIDVTFGGLILWNRVEATLSSVSDTSIPDHHGLKDIDLNLKSFEDI